MQSRCVPSLLLALMSASVMAQSPSTDGEPGLRLMLLQPAPETVYAPPRPLDRSTLGNEGAVKLSVDFRYLTDYVYRGVEFFEPSGQEDAANFQFDVEGSLDLGEFPHPFIRVFTNAAESDAISGFQEVRPSVGARWEIAPITLEASYQAFLFPDRSALESNEIVGRIELNDAQLFDYERSILRPYVLGAYDFDNYKGMYIEAGFKHPLPINKWGITADLDARIAYVNSHERFAGPSGNASGFQHYQFGVTTQWELNETLNISRRYGSWSLTGYLYYTDGIENDLLSNTELWGGAGIRFRY